MLINYWEQEDIAVFEKDVYVDNKESDLISIKLPSSLPPYTENLDKFEWVNGEVNIEGTIYQYVKRKITHDSIEFLCVPHVAKMKYESARERFFKLCNDLQENTHQKKNSNLTHIKLASFEYHAFPTLFDILKPADNALPSFFINDADKPVAKTRFIDHPPETYRFI